MPPATREGKMLLQERYVVVKETARTADKARWILVKYRRDFIDTVLLTERTRHMTDGRALALPRELGSLPACPACLPAAHNTLRTYSSSTYKKEQKRSPGKGTDDPVAAD
jgi:hypothetical protein